MNEWCLSFNKCEQYERNSVKSFPVVFNSKDFAMKDAWSARQTCITTETIQVMFKWLTDTKDSWSDTEICFITEILFFLIHVYIHPQSDGQTYLAYHVARWSDLPCLSRSQMVRPTLPITQPDGQTYLEYHAARWSDLPCLSRSQMVRPTLPITQPDGQTYLAYHAARWSDLPCLSLAILTVLPLLASPI